MMEARPAYRLEADEDTTIVHHIAEGELFGVMRFMKPMAALLARSERTRPFESSKRSLESESGTAARARVISGKSSREMATRSRRSMGAVLWLMPIEREGHGAPNLWTWLTMLAAQTMIMDASTAPERYAALRPRKSNGATEEEQEDVDPPEDKGGQHLGIEEIGCAERGFLYEDRSKDKADGHAGKAEEKHGVGEAFEGVEGRKPVKGNPPGIFAGLALGFKAVFLHEVEDRSEQAEAQSGVGG